MDFRTAYTRRLENAARRQKRLGTLAVFGVTAGVTALLAPELMAARGSQAGSAEVAQALPARTAPAPAQAQPGAARRVYPYSIIPGGVSGVAELKRVIRADRVVAAHYADFAVERAREVIVAKPRAVYVSYRKGDQVFWTAKKVMLAQGETLLSDGANEMRARCANRISDVPRFPVEAHGPGEAELDTVVAGAQDTVEGMFLATAAAMDAEPGGSGARYPLAYFPDGAGLVRPAAAPAGRRSAIPSVPQADRSALYDLGPGKRASSMARASAAQDDGGAAPGAGSSGGSTGGSTGSGSGEESVAAPGPEDAAATDGEGTPVNDGPSAMPGSGPDNGDGNGDGDTGGPAGGSGADGTGDAGQPGFPAPQAGPELPPQGPATPGAPPLPAPPDDIELPAAPVEVPEPATLWLSSAATAAMLWLRRKGARPGR